MLFQLRTDNHIDNSENLSASVRADVESALTPQYGDQLRRVEVYLQDVNSHKGGTDKRCTMEAHLAGHQPVVTHSTAAAVDEAVSSALDKLVRALEHTFGRLSDRRGAASTGDIPNQR